eukprot:364992-Chlamydomonas_euryale.AAC.4
MTSNTRTADRSAATQPTWRQKNERGFRVQALGFRVGWACVLIKFPLSQIFVCVGRAAVGFVYRSSLYSLWRLVRLGIVRQAVSSRGVLAEQCMPCFAFATGDRASGSVVPRCSR